MNECEGRDTFVFEGKLKSFISEEKITMNPKFMRPVQINNYAEINIFGTPSKINEFNVTCASMTTSSSPA